MASSQRRNATRAPARGGPRPRARARVGFDVERFEQEWAAGGTALLRLAGRWHPRELPPDTPTLVVDDGVRTLRLKPLPAQEGDSDPQVWHAVFSAPAGLLGNGAASYVLEAAGAHVELPAPAAGNGASTTTDESTQKLAEGPGPEREQVPAQDAAPALRDEHRRRVEAEHAAQRAQTELARVRQRVAELEHERDAAQQRAQEAEQARLLGELAAAAATSAASTQGAALEALEQQAKEADAAARRAREQRQAAEQRAEQTDARAARLAARAERRSRELAASRDAAREQLAEARATLRHAARRIETLERERDHALADAEPELGRAARPVVPRRELSTLSTAPPRGLPPEWVVGMILTLVGAVIVALVAIGTVRVDLIP